MRSVWILLITFIAIASNTIMEVESGVMTGLEEFEPSDEALNEFVATFKPTAFSLMRFRAESVYRNIAKKYEGDTILKMKVVNLFQVNHREQFWTFFFHGIPIDDVHIMIRKQITNELIGERIITKDPDEIQLYREFSQWVDDYTQMDRRLKLIYFAKFHHSRIPHGNHHPQMLHTLFQLKSGSGRGGISTELTLIKTVCPDGIIKGHQQGKFGENDQGKIIFSQFDFTMCDTHENFNASPVHFDETLRQLHIQTIFSDSFNDINQNLLSHFKVSPIPDRNEMVFNVISAEDSIRLRESLLEKTRKDHIKVHILYYLLDMALQSGLHEFELDTSLARKAASTLGMNDPIQVDRLCELVRCIAISSAAWTALANRNKMKFDIYLFQIALLSIHVSEKMVADALYMLAF